MARPRVITEDELLSQLDRYWLATDGDVRKLKIPAFGTFIRQDPAYRDVQDYTIRRCKAVRDRMVALKADSKELMARVAVFEAVPDSVIDDICYDRQKLVKFIRSRDTYYASLTEYAARCTKKYDLLEKQRDESKAEVEKLRIKLEKLEADLKRTKKELRETQSKYGALKAAAKRSSDEVAAGLLQGPGSPFKGPDLSSDNEIIRFDTPLFENRTASVIEELEDEDW